MGEDGFGAGLSAGRREGRPSGGNLRCGLESGTGLGASPSLIPRVSELSPSGRPNPASPSMAPPSRSQVPKGCKGPACALRCFTVSASMEQGPPGSSVHGILQARTPGWGALLQGTFATQGPTLYLLSPALAGMFFTASTFPPPHPGSCSSLMQTLPP